MPFTLHYLSLKPYNCFLTFYSHYFSQKGFPGGSNGKESACSAGDLGLIPGLERSAGEGNGYPVKYSYLSMDRGAWWTTAHSVQFSRSVVSDSLRPHESQHARPPCSSPIPGVHSDSHPSSP